MADQHDPRYAERMFPAPADHGIALPDRAVSTVRSGTDTAQSGDYKNERWYQGSGRIGERPVESIAVYPPTGGVATQGDPFEPVKIGVLIDMDLGQLTADLMDPIILAVEDALNEGVYDRPVEIVTVDARGLPRENYRKVRLGYQKLVEDGCVVVIGPFISDNSVNVCDLVNSTGVACLGWTGTTRFAGEYCFTVANGDIPTEGWMGADWCFRNGYRKVGFFWEQGSSGDLYADYFRAAARYYGLDVIKETQLGPNPRYEAMLQRFEARFGRVSRNVVVALSYDTARAAIGGIGNARIATPEEVKAGLERIKWMPCTNGGPGCYLTFAEYDHRGYKGDFLTIRELRGGELHFRGYYRPQHPSNTSSPLLKQE